MSFHKCAELENLDCIPGVNITAQGNLRQLGNVCPKLIVGDWVPDALSVIGPGITNNMALELQKSTQTDCNWSVVFLVGGHIGFQIYIRSVMPRSSKETATKSFLLKAFLPPTKVSELPE